jgi:hypothetical protein
MKQKRRVFVSSWLVLSRQASRDEDAEEQEEPADEDEHPEGEDNHDGPAWGVFVLAQCGTNADARPAQG